MERTNVESILRTTLFLSATFNYLTNYSDFACDDEDKPKGKRSENEVLKMMKDYNSLEVKSDVFFEEMDYFDISKQDIEKTLPLFLDTISHLYLFN